MILGNALNQDRTKMITKLIIGLAGAVLLQLPQASHARSCTTQPDQPESEAAIRMLELQWSRAYWTGDTNFLECLYAADFLSVDSRGELHDRTDDIASSMKHAGEQWKPGGGQSIRILMHPRQAIVTTVKAGAVHGLRVTDIYEYDGRHWHAVFAQDTKF